MRKLIPAGFGCTDSKAQLIIERQCTVVVRGNGDSYRVSRTALQKRKGEIGPSAAVFGQHGHGSQFVFVELANAVGMAVLRKGQKGPLFFTVDPAIWARS